MRCPFSEPIKLFGRILNLNQIYMQIAKLFEFSEWLKFKKYRCATTEFLKHLKPK